MTYSGSYDCNTSQVLKLTETMCANSVGNAGSCRWSSSKSGTIQIVGSASGSKYCLSAVSLNSYCCSYGQNITYCDNQCEADSVSNGGIILECQYDAVENKWYKYTCTGGKYCADGACRRDYYMMNLCVLRNIARTIRLPEGCEQEHDTTLFACSDNASGNSGLYRLNCRTFGGVVTSCNGKTDVDVVADGTLIRPMQGTCVQNGFESGIVGGASADSSAQEPQSANADCFAVLGSKCYMRDKASGNTFSCDCDGSCDKAIRDLILGSGCSNPYPQPNNDSLFFGE